MTRIFFLIVLLTFYKNGSAQIPATRETIQSFIDSIGKSTDRQVITSSTFPAFADGTNFTSRINIWRNNKKKLLWVETIIADSISTVFFYCKDNLIFASERTYISDTISNKRKSLFRNIFFDQSRIIEDSAPGRNSNDANYYLRESKKYLELSKKAD